LDSDGGDFLFSDEEQLREEEHIDNIDDLNGECEEFSESEVEEEEENEDVDDDQLDWMAKGPLSLLGNLHCILKH